MNRSGVPKSSLNFGHKNGLGRLLTAMVTPFDAQGEVDYRQAKKLALSLLESVVMGWWSRAPLVSLLL